VVVCKVPTSRLDEVVRDAEQEVSQSLTARLFRMVVVVVVAALTAGITNELSESTTLVALTTALGLLLGYFVVWVRPVWKAVTSPRRTEHWRSAVSQGGYSIRSRCDHQVAELRVEVLHPDGRIFHRDFTTPVPDNHMRVRAERSVAAYPVDFAGAPPLVEGRSYTVVWYARRLPGSRWMEVARHEFVTPYPSGVLEQPA
jgi:hypothetical protein